MLENCMVPSVDMLIDQNEWWQFQQYMAPAHTAHKVKAWMKEKKVDLLPWPARSPDLNPIEFIWAWMDKELVKVRIRSINSLKQELDTIWR